MEMVSLIGNRPTEEHWWKKYSDVLTLVKVAIPALKMLFKKMYILLTKCS